MLDKLTKIAGELDQKGFYALADQCDGILKMALTHSHITRALKEDDHEAALKALSTFVSRIPYGSTPGQELGLTDEEFRNFALAIRKGNLDEARRIFGVEKIEIPKETEISETEKDTKLRLLLKDMYSFIKNRGGTLENYYKRNDSSVLISFLPPDPKDVKEFKTLYSKSNNIINDEQIGDVTIDIVSFLATPSANALSIAVYVTAHNLLFLPSLWDRVKDIFGY